MSFPLSMRIVVFYPKKEGEMSAYDGDSNITLEDFLAKLKVKNLREADIVLADLGHKMYASLYALPQNLEEALVCVAERPEVAKRLGLPGDSSWKQIRDVLFTRMQQAIMLGDKYHRLSNKKLPARAKARPGRSTRDELILAIASRAGSSGTVEEIEKRSLEVLRELVRELKAMNYSLPPGSSWEAIEERLTTMN